MANRPRLIALNLQHRRPQHRWTQEERLLLCSMKRFFDLKNKEITRIFNHIYGNKIRAEGFSDGLPSSTLAIQYKDLWRRNHSDWHAVHTDVSFEQGPARFPHIIQIIRAACQDLQIGLVARARDLVVLPPQETSYRRASHNSTSTGNAILNAPRNPVVLHSAIVDQNHQASPEPSRHIPQASQTSESISTDTILTRPVPTEAVSRIRSFALGNNNQQPTRPNQVPNILWRFSNDASMGINHRSGYIAGAFVNDIGGIPTPEDRAQEFPTWLEIHVRPRRILSPFISTSTDPLVAVHRALTQDRNAFVSIIDSTQINSQTIFFMKDLMRQYNIYTPGYRGAKEYVIWGFICRSAVITSIRADELVQIANTHPDIGAALRLDIISASVNCKSQLHNRLAEQTFESDFAVGKTIGKFLRMIHLQPIFLEDVSLSLNTAWSFTVSDDTTDFLQGANQGFQDTTADLSPADMPENTFHSQETIIQSNDESMSDDITRLVTQEVDLRDYVVVEHPQLEDVAQDIRQSMDRLSFHEDVEGDRSIEPLIRSSPAIASTTATPIVSVFNQDSESWIRVSETVGLTTPVVVESIENTLPSSGQGDNDGERGVKIEAETEPPVLCRTPNLQPRTGSQECAILQTPTSPKKHTRNSSESSESTISAQTPVASHRLSEDRSRVYRVLNYDWPSFWDSLQQSSSQ